MSVDGPADDFRGWAREQWGGLGEKAGKVLAIALDAKKTVRRRMVCSKCGFRQQKEFVVGDAKIALDALSWLTDSGFGRPGVQADAASPEGFTFIYTVVLADEDGTRTIEWLDDQGLLARPRAEVEELWADAHSSVSGPAELPDTVE